MTNAGGAVQATLTLTAFGQSIASSGSSTDPYQYAATSRYRNDGDAGLALVGCRYYDAQVGQFITRDTYLDQKPYAYCDGDPVNAVDPDGHRYLKIINKGKHVNIKIPRGTDGVIIVNTGDDVTIEPASPPSKGPDTGGGGEGGGKGGGEGGENPILNGIGEGIGDEITKAIWDSVLKGIERGVLL